jgi:hypothetical protein
MYDVYGVYERFVCVYVRPSCPVYLGHMHVFVALCVNRLLLPEEEKQNKEHSTANMWDFMHVMMYSEGLCAWLHACGIYCVGVVNTS